MKKIKLVNQKKLGRPGVTYQDVSKAIEYLASKNIEPTLHALKEVLVHGGVTTISNYRAKYISEHNKSHRSSVDYLRGYRDAMKAMKVFIQDNNK